MTDTPERVAVELGRAHAGALLDVELDVVDGDRPGLALGYYAELATLADTIATTARRRLGIEVARHQSRGLTYNDLGDLIGVSAQRAHQLAGQPPPLPNDDGPVLDTEASLARIREIRARLGVAPAPADVLDALAGNLDEARGALLAGNGEGLRESLRHALRLSATTDQP